MKSINAVKRCAPAVGVAVVLSVGLVGSASAASLLDAAAVTAITSGFTDFLDTVKAVLATSWPFMLGGMALMATPALIGKMFKHATKG